MGAIAGRAATCSRYRSPPTAAATTAHTLTTTHKYEGYANQPTLLTDPRGAVTKIVSNGISLPTEVTEAFGAPEAGTTKTAYNAYGQPTPVGI